MAVSSISPGFPLDPDLFCITDVGSTTTKARLFLREGGGWRVVHAESPTTVERPHEDVTAGVRRAFEMLEAETGRTLWAGGRPAVPYLSTSSAGGGLAMVVTGLVTAITSRSAERVALGAGAIVLDVLALDDGRTPYGKIQALEALRPDIVLLAGGFDGENISGPVFLAELLNQAALRPKLSAAARLPVIYAGNAQAAALVEEALGARFTVRTVPNLRPGAEKENLGPAHDAIHDTFMEHVMSQAPGYPTLLDWVAAPVLPTPSAFGSMLALASKTEDARILAVDIGGATTDVFTAEKGRVERTVSANLGMSYSILNVLRRVGLDAVCGLIAPAMEPDDVANRIGEKLLHPTRLPETEEDARVERAVAALAIREAVRDHLRVLRGVSLDRGVEDLEIRSVMKSGGSEQRSAPRPVERKPEPLRGYDLVIGSGGILSHADPAMAARILCDGLKPGGRVELAIDEGFVVPHLGVLASVQPELASRLFGTVALRRLGRVQEQSGRASDHGPAERSGSPRREDSVSPRSLGSPPVEAAATPEPAPIVVDRKLILPGEVTVSPGQRVGSDTIVARCTRLFPRPFFVRPALALQCGADEVASYLLKKPGEVIEAGAILARRKTSPITTKEFRSNVSGVFERLLPDGTLLVREHEQAAQEVWTVEAARDLGVPPKRLSSYLRCRVGQEVDKGQWLAASTGFGIPRTSVAPGRGRVAEIDAEAGTIRILPLREELHVTAWLPGEVAGVSDRGAAIRGAGIEMAGVWGTGSEAWGTLEDARGLPSEPARARRILLHDGCVTRAELEGWAAAGAAGVIAAGARMIELLAWAPPIPLILMGGFGAERLDDQRHALLNAHLGRWTVLDATTEIRVGVRRPRIILVATEQAPEQGSPV